MLDVQITPTPYFEKISFKPELYHWPDRAKEPTYFDYQGTANEIFLKPKTSEKKRSLFGNIRVKRERQSPENLVWWLKQGLSVLFVEEKSANEGK